MTSVTLERIRKSYGAAPAVRGIDLVIEDGEFVSLLGPSGCGKTTTLRCIAGFEVPDSGSIRFGEREVSTLPTRDRDIGMVFQNYALFPHMTVAENLAFGLEMRRVGAAETRRRVADVLAMVQLGGLTGRYPRELSGGQQQRVALARALVIEPQVLLLDEPLANLDAKLREEMRLFIRAIQKRVGITTVYVTHDQAEAMFMSDRVVVMFDGAIHQVGTPRAVYGSPASRRVANFVGQSNFITGQVRGVEPDLVHVLDTEIGTVRARSGDRLEVGSAATLLLRPEAIRLQATPTLDGFPVRVRDQHFLGNLELLSISFENGTMVQVEQAPDPSRGSDEHLWCTLSADQCWLIPDRGGAAA